MVKINGWKYSEIIIDGKPYFSDVIVWWDGTIENKSAEGRFRLSDMKSLLKSGPESVVIGTGSRDELRVTENVKLEAQKNGVKLFIDKTENAIDIFNGLMAEKKRVVGVIRVL